LSTLNILKKIAETSLIQKSQCKVQSLASQNNADIFISTLKRSYRNYYGSSFISSNAKLSCNFITLSFQHTELQYFCSKIPQQRAEYSTS